MRVRNQLNSTEIGGQATASTASQVLPQRDHQQRYRAMVAFIDQAFDQRQQNPAIATDSYLALLKKHQQRRRQQGKPVASVMDDGENYEAPSTAARLYDLIIQNQIQFDRVGDVKSSFIEYQGEFILIREALEKKALSDEHQQALRCRMGYQYKNMAINYAIALLILFKTHKIELDENQYFDAIEQFNNTSNVSLQQSLDNDGLDWERYFLGFVNHVLVPRWQEAEQTHPNCLPPVAVSKDIIKILDKAKDWVGMVLPSYHIATRTPFTYVQAEGSESTVRLDRYALRIDSPLVSNYSDDPDFHQEVLSWYGNHSDTRYRQRAWYRALKDHERKMYDEYYQRKVGAGREKTSQLRDRLPGLSNGKKSEMHIGQVQVGPQPNVLSQEAAFFHNGSLPTFSEWEGSAKFAAQQQAYFSQRYGYDRHMMVTLNSKRVDFVLTVSHVLKTLWWGVKSAAYSLFVGPLCLIGCKKWKPPKRSKSKAGYDARIIQYSRRAAHRLSGVDGNKKVPLSQRKMLHSNLCFNAFRSIESADWDGVKAIQEDASQMVTLLNDRIQQLHQERDRLQSTLAPYQGTRFIGERLHLNNQIEVCQKKLAQCQLSLNRIQQGLANLEERLSVKRAAAVRLVWAGRDKNINNCSILSEVNALSFRIKDSKPLLSHQQQAEIQTTAAYSGCASGENRTGIGAYVTQIKAAESAFRREGVSLRDTNVTQIKIRFAQDGHDATVMSSQGGNAGCYGLRRKSKPPKNMDWSKDDKTSVKVKDNLQSKAADMKSVNSALAGWKRKIKKSQRKKNSRSQPIALASREYYTLVNQQLSRVTNPLVCRQNRSTVKPAVPSVTSVNKPFQEPSVSMPYSVTRAVDEFTGNKTAVKTALLIGGASLGLYCLGLDFACYTVFTVGCALFAPAGGQEVYSALDTGEPLFKVTV